MESDLACPTLVMRNMRQVMSGLTNYLLITGEGDLANIVKMATREEPGIRLETVLEDLMQEMVVRPLSKHLHCLMFQQHQQSQNNKKNNFQKVDEVTIIIYSFI